MMLVASVIVLTQPGPLHLTPSLNNPFSFGPDLRGGEPFSPLVTLFTIIAAPAIPLTLVTRYRMAGHTERQQLKWFALAGVDLDRRRRLRGLGLDTERRLAR